MHLSSARLRGTPFTTPARPRTGPARCSTFQSPPSAPAMQSAHALRKLQSVVSPMPRQGSSILRRGVKTQALVEMAALAAVAGTGALAALAISFFDLKRKTGIPELLMAETPFNKAIIDSCPTLTSTYHPSLFLTNGHVETIIAAKTRSKPPVEYQRECLLRPDGGCVSLDWEHLDSQHHALPDDAPVLILLPGLTGGSGDSYVRHAVLQAREAGIRAVVFNSRGTADSPVTSTQFYSASFTGDMRAVVSHVARKYPDSVLLAAGWSLGANIMTRYLGEEGANTPLQAAVSMCNPFELTISNANFEKGFNRVYDWNLAGALSRIFRKHQLLWTGVGGRFKPEVAANARTVKEFDEAITIHSFGFNTVADYYAASSSSLSVPQVAIPLLCLQADDDPIAPKEAIPTDALLANPNCILVNTRCGGHLGWVSGPGGYTGAPWSGPAMFEYLTAAMKQLQGQGKLRTAAQAVAAGAVLETEATVGVSAEDEMVAAGMPMTQRAGAIRVMAASVVDKEEEEQQGASSSSSSGMAAARGGSPSSGHGAMADWECVESADVQQRQRQSIDGRKSGAAEGGGAALPGEADARARDLEVHYE